MDSAGVAGLIDLLRTKGSWFHAMRFGYLFGPKRTTLSYAIPDQSCFQALAEAAEDVFTRAIPQVSLSKKILPSSLSLARALSLSLSLSLSSPIQIQTKANTNKRKLCNRTRR